MEEKIFERINHVLTNHRKVSLEPFSVTEITTIVLYCILKFLPSFENFSEIYCQYASDYAWDGSQAKNYDFIVISPEKRESKQQFTSQKKVACT